jgi:hypothetical protein
LPLIRLPFVGVHSAKAGSYLPGWMGVSTAGRRRCG